MRSVRVCFKKHGPAKYISHLDLNRFMIKIIRMSRIPVWYSEGFNPHPYITFAQPLSLGFESNYEFMDLRVNEDDFSNDDVFNALVGLMPEGITLVSCNDPVMKSGEIAYAEYKISFDTNNIECMDKLVDFLSQDSIVTKKKTKKGSFKDIDLKEFVKNYSVDGPVLKLTLSAGSSNNLNPKLILDAFENKCQYTLPYYFVTRTMLYNKDMKEFK